MAASTFLLSCGLGLLGFALLPAESRRKVARQAHLKANATASCEAGSFCQCRELGASSDRDRPLYIWSAADVQFSVRDYYTTSEARCKPHAAYAVAYAAMTKKRDVERCASSGPMKPPAGLPTELNDALADLMSRYFVNIVNGTAGGADVDGVWAALRSDALGGFFGDWNSLQYAMASTAIYLTTHMGLALSALPHSAELWQGTAYTTVPARAEAMRTLYKDAYDGFNGFLADNVNIIGEALWETRLVSSKNINIAATLAPNGVVAQTFEEIRTKTFNLAIRVAEEIPLGQHPLTQHFGGATVMATNPKISGSLAPAPGSALYELAEHARFWRRHMGDGLGPVWRALGGLDYFDLRPGSSYHEACEHALR